jgi:hypothetical protein
VVSGQPGPVLLAARFHGLAAQARRTRQEQAALAALVLWPAALAGRQVPRLASAALAARFP